MSTQTITLATAKAWKVGDPTIRLTAGGGQNLLGLGFPLAGSINGKSILVTALNGDVLTVSTQGSGAASFPSGASVTFTVTGQLSGGGSGTVTTVSVASANGFTGTVATATTTPAITLTTSITGLLVGNGTAITAAADVSIGASGQLNQSAIAAPGSPVAGDRWYDSTQLCVVEYGGSATSADCMPLYRVGVVYQQVAVTNMNTLGATTPTSIFTTTGAIGSLSLPAGFLNVLGRTLTLRVKGFASTVASPGNLYVLVKLGSNIIATSTAAALGASKTTVGWSIDLDVTCKKLGTSGLLDSGGIIAPGTAGGTDVLPIAAISNGTVAATIAPATQTPLDLTQAYVFDFQFEATVGGNEYWITNAELSVKC